MPYRQTVLDFWQGCSRHDAHDIWIMTLAPFGIFGLTARGAKSGIHQQAILAFGACVVAASSFTPSLRYPCCFAWRACAIPFACFPHDPALLTAFSTASSAATLPLSLECLEKRAGVSERIASLSCRWAPRSITPQRAL